MKTPDELIQLASIMPKAELHLHIEGSLEPELMLSLAQRNNISLKYDSIEAIKEAYQFHNLQAFLDLYYQGMSVLITEADFYELTWAYLTKSHAQNVLHVEIFFDPQGHLERNVPISTQINGIYRALTQAQAQWGMSFNLILSFLRHLSEESAFHTLNLAKPHLDKIAGIGLDSSELGHPPQKFARVFAECKKLGLKLTAHAGEEGPPAYVWEALDSLKVDRIDHGNRALEDDHLVACLNNTKHTLTVCPLSNLKLCVVSDLSQHPIQRMLKLGLKATINSDDPAYFGGYMTENYTALIESVALSEDELYQLAQNSFHGAWIDAPQKQQYLANLAEYFKKTLPA